MEAFCLTKQLAIFLYNYGGKNIIYDKIFTKHKELEESFVLVESQDCSNDARYFEIEMNTEDATLTNHISNQCSK